MNSEKKDLRIVIMGCPGAGKGTQAKRLCQRFGLTHFSTGDLLRAEISNGTSLGRKVEDYLRRGSLVPDEIMVELTTAKLDAAEGGWLLDGFPRTLPQAQELQAFLTSNGRKLDMVLALELKEGVVIRRLTSRWSCPACGEVFNLLTRPPSAAGKCDRCSAALTQRPDDTEATVRRRLMVYEDLTRPLVAYYRGENLYEEVDADRSMDEVSAAVAALIEGTVLARK